MENINKIVLPADAFRRVAMFRHMDSELGTIRGVYVAGDLMCAINGHDLLQFKGTFLNPPEKPIVVRVHKDLPRYLKLKSAKHLVIEGNRLYVVDSHFKELFIMPGGAFIDGDFPSLKKLYSNKKAYRSTSMVFPAKSVNLYYKAFGKDVALDCKPSGKEKPIFVDIVSPFQFEGYKGIFMPMKIEEEKY